MPTVMSKKTYKLENILSLSHYMKIAIDDAVCTDENGNYLINVGYLRVSTDKQADEGYGLDLQEKAVVKYCKDNGFTNLVLFIDDGYTGTNMDRPALQGIISYIQDYNRDRSSIRIKSMIIPRIDRLGRTLLGTLQFIQDYIIASKDSKNSSVNTNKEDITFISVQENYCRIEESNPQGKFLLMLFAGMAELDRDLIVGKLKDGRTARVASGKWPGGGIVPFGYKYDKEQSRLIVIPEEAEKVREAFRLYVEEKMSPQKIATRLGFKGERIVTQILKRKSLTGCIVYNGKEYRGEHEPIISLERWQEAQEELEKRSVHRGESNYLLSGLLFCGKCGARMRYQKWGKSGDCKLVCYSRQKSKPYLVKDENCTNSYLWAKDVEEAVIKTLFSMTYLGKLENKMQEPLDVTASLVENLKREKNLLNSYYKRLDMIERGESAELPEFVEGKIQEISARVRSLDEQLKNDEEKMHITRSIERTKSIFRNLESTWPHMTDVEKQAVIREIFDRIVIDGEEISADLKLKSFLAK